MVVVAGELLFLEFWHLGADVVEVLLAPGARPDRSRRHRRTVEFIGGVSRPVADGAGLGLEVGALDERMRAGAPRGAAGVGERVRAWRPRMTERPETQPIKIASKICELCEGTGKIVAHKKHDRA